MSLSLSFLLVTKTNGLTRELHERFGLEVDEVEEGLLERSKGLVLIRNLSLNPDEFKELCEKFGVVEVMPVDGSHERLVTDHVHEFSEAPSSKRREWHQDQTFREPRPSATAMYCLNTGDEGETLFASTYAARQDLPRINLKLPHSKRRLFQSLSLNSEDSDAVWRNVEDDSGGLCLNPKAMPPSQEIDDLVSFVTSPQYVYEHRWQKGDFLIWSNYLTMHAATPLTKPRERLMWRATII